MLTICIVYFLPYIDWDIYLSFSSNWNYQLIASYLKRSQSFLFQKFIHCPKHEFSTNEWMGKPNLLHFQRFAIVCVMHNNMQLIMIIMVYINDTHHLIIFAIFVKLSMTSNKMLPMLKENSGERYTVKRFYRRLLWKNESELAHWVSTCLRLSAI